MTLNCGKRLIYVTVLMMMVLSIALPIQAAATGIPGTPHLSSTDPSSQGSYTVTMNMWWGNNGTSWKVYENNNLIYTSTLADNSPNAQTVSYSFTDKPDGVYRYHCELINAYGTTTSESITVSIGSVNSITGINISGVDHGEEAVQLTIDQGTTDYILSATDVANPSFSLFTNNSSVIDFQLINGTTLRLNGLKAGRASLQIKETTTNKVRYVGIRVKTGDGGLPGMPDYLAIGSVGTNVDRDLNFMKDFQPGDKNKRMDVRYIYLNGEPDAWDRNVDGWQKWGGAFKGDRAITYIRENRKLGIVPFFVYYTICGSNESYGTDLAHIQDPQYLKFYFKDLKFLLDTIAAKAGDDLVGIIFEPDFIGYMMQNSGLQPDQITANTRLVYESAYGGADAAGILNSNSDRDPLTGQPFADNLQGLVRCINYLVNQTNTTKGTNIYFGWQFNIWANPYPGTPSKGLMHKTDEAGIADGRDFIRARAQETADYYIKAGILSSGATCISIDKYGQDAVANDLSAAANPQNSTWFWNADHWNNYLIYISQLHQKTNLPVILWQMPVGHIERSQAADPYHGGLFNELINTEANGACYFEDSTTTFFFGDQFKPGAGNRWNWFTTNEGGDAFITDNGSDMVTWGEHFSAARDAGVVCALFGAGVGRATHGNVSDITQALEPEDDMWFLVKTQRYLANPVVLNDDGTSTPVP